jgi:hypothetical protein
MKFGTVALLIASLFVAVPAWADPPAGFVTINRYSPTQLGISATQLSTCPSFTIPMAGSTSLAVYVNLTWVAASQVTLACSAGPAATLTGAFEVNNPNGTTGQIPGNDSLFVRNVSSSKLIRINLSPVIDDFVVCTVCGVGATSDSISVWARAQTP